MRAAVNCPGCGAPLAAANPGLVMAVCEHCGQAVYWDEASVSAVGKKARLSEGFTRLYRGATGRVSGRAFRVHGRLRYAFGRGFWDEWFVELEDGTAWLTEDNHELCLERPVVARVPPFSAFSAFGAARRLTVEGVDFVVEETGEAECIGAEGQLPELVVPGERYRYVDGSSLDGRRSLGIEYDAEPPKVFVGTWLSHGDVALDDEGEDW